MSEVLIHSNEKNDPGIKNRRIYEATLLKSTLAPFYSPPNSPLMPEGPIKIMLKETIVPIGMEQGSAAAGDNSEYYIWRTKMDYKVRPEHLEREGRVFRRDKKPLPEDDYNCRCWAEPVTQNIKIIDNTYGGFKSMDHFLRYGGGATIIISG